MKVSDEMGFGIIDPKGELFLGVLCLLQHRLSQLSRTNPDAAKRLRRRIVIYDFASRDPLSPYNILARWESADPEFFALTRADLIMDLLDRGDRLSLGGVGSLQKMFLLLSEFHLPITFATDLIRDEAFRRRLLLKSKNRELIKFFAHQFESVPKPTLAAIERRIEALMASESVRLALNGIAAPDFRALQDEGRIVLINCFGENIARSVRRLLQCLVFSDICQGVFGRRNKSVPFLWICDEAQNFFAAEKLQDKMTDLLTMSRSFGSFFMFLTQNISTAVGDPRTLKVLHTNIRWSFSMRGDPADCEFMRSALPITGRKLKAATSPFEERTFYQEREERQIVLDGISRLPDRTGYLWFKSQGRDAIRIRTSDLVMPHGQDLESAVQSIRRDTTVGWRVSRKTYDQQIADRDASFEEPAGEFSNKLEETYRRRRGSA